jgi:hypothetical protein
MKKFIVSEIEQTVHYFTVEADTPEEARETFSDMYEELWECQEHKTQHIESYVYDITEVTDNEATSIN